jgi:hypothetical protein
VRCPDLGGTTGVVEEYLDELPQDRRKAISALCEVVNANLPEGYEESMASGSPGSSRCRST